MKILRKASSLQSRILSRLLFQLPQKCSNLEKQVAFRFLRSVGVKRPGSIFSFTSPSELITLLRWAMSCPAGSVGLEIGSHLGASSLFIAGGLGKNGGRLYCVDTWQNQTMPDGIRDTWKEFHENTKAMAESITPLRGFSTDISLDDIPGKIDFAFIDGDHSYEAVKSDFLHYEPKFTEKTVIAFHDTTSFRGVRKWTGELLQTGDWKIADFRESLLVIRRSDFTN